jgi:hypothetical protein
VPEGASFPAGEYEVAGGRFAKPLEDAPQRPEEGTSPLRPKR